MADIGFEISGTNIATRTIRPDNDFQRNMIPAVKTAKFGDGYEQRGRKGINNIEQTFAMQFKNRDKADADDIVKFFDDKAGVTSFIFTYPDINSSTNDSDGNAVTSIRVVCLTWSVQYIYGSHYNVNANFKRVYGV